MHKQTSNTFTDPTHILRETIYSNELSLHTKVYHKKYFTHIQLPKWCTYKAKHAPFLCKINDIYEPNMIASTNRVHAKHLFIHFFPLSFINTVVVLRKWGDNPHMTAVASSSSEASQPIRREDMRENEHNGMGGAKEIPHNTAAIPSPTFHSLARPFILSLIHSFIKCEVSRTQPWLILTVRDALVVARRWVTTSYVTPGG